MSYTITAKQLDDICSSVGLSTVTPFVPALNAAFAKYNINTKNRAAAFIAQVGHESGEFVFTKENLNYSKDALLRTFKKYFPNAALAAQYERNPQAIANRVYANRMGNGDAASGDGWKFKGRGLIQLTGRSNYAAFAGSIGKNLDDTIAYLETVGGAVESAAWFWTKNGLNEIADGGEANFTKITQRINGGQNGAPHRLTLYKRALAVL